MYRPDNWEKCPCDDCPEKQDDIYGRFCDLACGKWTAWKNHEAGADAMLEALRQRAFCHTFSEPDKDGLYASVHGKFIASGKLAFIPDD